MNDLDLDGSGDGTAQLLMALAERADVIVDFRGLADGTVMNMTNLGPDEPFGGGIPVTDCDDDDCFEPADPETTGQVMRFKVDSALLCTAGECTDGTATDPADLVLNAEGPLEATTGYQDISLNELESEDVCVLLDVDADAFIEPIKEVDCEMEDPDGEIDSGIDVVPFGPTEALLGQVDFSGSEPEGIPLKWTADNVGVKRTVTVPAGPVDVWVTENPATGAIEEWDIYNFTADAHPIHLHLVRFEVTGREVIGGDARDPEPWETGFKDTVISYPGEITTVKALFDVPGLYVWHCHIVEHEDNEMMRPYFVGP
jgi:FtsP/CotA-like multicopper oxidase with cupredoxin domain